MRLTASRPHVFKGLLSGWRSGRSLRQRKKSFQTNLSAEAIAPPFKPRFLFVFARKNGH
jgi:hypothetical protein